MPVNEIVWFYLFVHKQHMDLTMTTGIHAYTTGVLRNSLILTVSITRAHLPSSFMAKRSINGHLDVCLLAILLSMIS